MNDEEKCGIGKAESILKKNNTDFDDLIAISDIIESEVWMEPCIDEDYKFQDDLITSNKSDDFVVPIRNDKCKISIGTHTHPENLIKGYEGISVFSPRDKVFGITKLLDSGDPMALFCVQGLNDDKIKCMINLKKLDCSAKDKIIEFDAYND